MEKQGYHFQTNVYPLDLQGSNIVLGMLWLRNLGKVLHNWEKLTMKFHVDEEKHFVCSDTTKEVATESLQTIKRLMDKEVNAYFMQNHRRLYLLPKKWLETIKNWPNSWLDMRRFFKLPQLCHPQGSKAITLDLGLDPTQLMLGPIVTFTSKKMKLSML